MDRAASRQHGRQRGFLDPFGDLFGMRGEVLGALERPAHLRGPLLGGLRAAFARDQWVERDGTAYGWLAHPGYRDYVKFASVRHPIGILNSAVFMMFAFSFARPQSARDWRSFGAFAAFIVALFVEMYGFPLTIYLFSGWLQTRLPEADLLSHDAGHLPELLFGWRANPHFGPFHVLSTILIAAGFPVAAERLWLWDGGEGNGMVTKNVVLALDIVVLGW